MRGKIIANIIACLLPSKRLRHKLRRWKGFETNYDKLQKELDYIKNLLKFALGSPSDVPKTRGLLRAIQLVSAKKMQQIDAVLKESGIDYWLDFGGLLGAVRHGGFIPWDDDLDISIDIDDKSKLIALLKEKGIDYDAPNGEDGLIRISCMPQSEGYDKSPQYGVHIDVFSYKKMESLSAEDIVCIESSMRELRKKYACYSRAYHEEVMSLLNNYRPIDNSGSYSILVRGNDYVETIAKAKYVVPVTDVFPCVEVGFESYSFKAPAKYPEYLSDIYGDYMSWPPSFEWGKVENILTEKDRHALLRLFGE